MKTKLLAFMMMGLATFGSVFGIASANSFGGNAGAANASPTFQGGFGVNAENTQGITLGGTGADQGSNLINIIKSAINWVLSILGLITLVLLLWGGFQMVTAAGDDGKYKAGFKILKQAGIGLAFIALAWFMVTLIFWLIGTVGAGAKTT